MNDVSVRIQKNWLNILRKNTDEKKQLLKIIREKELRRVPVEMSRDFFRANYYFMAFLGLSMAIISIIGYI